MSAAERRRIAREALLDALQTLELAEAECEDVLKRIYARRRGEDPDAAERREATQ